MLFDLGDIIVVECFIYLVVLQVFQLVQVNIFSVDIDDDGMLVEQLVDLLEIICVKVVYLVLMFGNFGGKMLSEVCCCWLVELVKKYDFVILEDDFYGEISFIDVVWCLFYQYVVELSCEDQVVYILIFLKIFVSGMCIGWIVMLDWLVQQMVIVKQVVDLYINMLLQVIIVEYFSLNWLDNQIVLICEDYCKKCVVLVDVLESCFGEYLEFSCLQGGMFLWVCFCYLFDIMEWMKKMLENGVVYVLGEVFYYDKLDICILCFFYFMVLEVGLLMVVEWLVVFL